MFHFQFSAHAMNYQLSVLHAGSVSAAAGVQSRIIACYMLPMRVAGAELHMHCTLPIK